MILRLGIILSAVSYKRKNILFYGKNVQLTKKNIFNTFVMEFFLTIASHQFLKNDWIFHKSWLIFLGEIYLITLLFSILKLSKKS